MLRGFYAICDVTPDETFHEDLERRIVVRAESLLAAGPCMLQLRAKAATGGRLWQLGKALRPLCTSAGVPFCVNDRLDVALAVGADAVHLGQDDLPLAAAKAALASWGRPMWIGVSTHDEDQAARAVQAGADYIGFGPVFPTDTKQDPDPVVGLDRLAVVARTSAVPVVAIGGITLENLAQVAATGAAAAAVISAVAKHPDPSAAGRQVKAAFYSQDA